MIEKVRAVCGKEGREGGEGEYVFPATAKTFFIA